MGKKSNSNSFLLHGSILAFASILCRVIGILYRIPLQRTLGDVGMGYYSAAFQVYSILLLLSSYSMPLAVSKLISARVAKGEYKNASKIFRDSTIFSLIMGALAGGITYFGADVFAGFTKYTHSSVALRMLAPTLVIMSVVGVLRGFFQGMGSMIPTAVSNILEQISNAIVSVVAAWYLYDFGSKIDASNGEDFNAVAWGAAGGTLGTGIGALCSLLFLVFTYTIYKKIYKRKLRRDRSRRILSHSEITNLIVLTIVPVILSTTIYNISEMLDSTIFGNIMYSVKHIEEETYSSLYGMFSGKYRLLTNVPVSIAASLASAIIPSLIASYSRGDNDDVLVKVDSSIKFTMLLAIPASVGMFVLSEPIMGLLFSGNIHIPGNMMRIGAISIIFYSISTITNSVLQGIDRMRVPIINSSIGLILHVIILSVLLATTDLGIYAVVISDVLFPLSICILNAISIKKYINYKQEWIDTFVKPGISAIFMGIVTFLVYKGCNLLIGISSVSCIIAIILAVVVYAVMLLLTKAVDEEQLYAMPKGHLIVKIFKRTGLL